jgi:beta-phosphoglucomutase
MVTVTARPKAALLFDFNGVLVDDEPIHFQAFQRVLSTIGHVMDPHEYRRYLGLDDGGTFAAFLRDHGDDVARGDLDRLVERKQAVYFDLTHDLTQDLPQDLTNVLAHGQPHLFPAARDLVLALHDAAVPMALVSGARRAEIDGVLAAARLERCFSVVVAAEDVDRCKPDPQGYRLAFRRLRGLYPHVETGVAVEDAPAGVTAALAAGLRCIAITTSCTPAELAAADRVVGSLKEIDPRSPLPDVAMETP